MFDGDEGIALGDDAIVAGPSSKRINVQSRKRRKRSCQRLIGASRDDEELLTWLQEEGEQARNGCDPEEGRRFCVISQFFFCAFCNAFVGVCVCAYVWVCMCENFYAAGCSMCLLAIHSVKAM